MSDSISTAPKPDSNPPPPPPQESAEETYRPLYLPALGGMALSLFAAFCVLVGGLVPTAVNQPGLFFGSLLLTPGLFAGVAALRGQRGLVLVQMALQGLALWAVVLGLGGLLVSGRTPWTLAAWFWAVLVIGIVVSWYAQSQIRASENTLSGEGFARIGLLTGLSVAILYGAYTASLNMAMQAQAQAAVTEFLDLVRQGDDVQAFIRTLPIGERPQPGTERDRIEGLFNIVTPPADTGEFSMFRDNPLFQLIRMGGDKVDLQQRGAEWAFDRGTYYVTFQYRATTPFHSFDFTVGASGQEVDEGTGKRRRWFVLRGGTKLSDTRQPVATERGQALNKRIELANKMLGRFAEAVGVGKVSDAFLLTRPVADREPPRSEELLKSDAYEEFKKGRTLDTSDTWSTGDDRPALQAVRDLFNPEVPRTVAIAEQMPVYDLQRPMRTSPRYWEEGDTFYVTYNLRLTVRDSSFVLPLYTGEIGVTLSGPLNAQVDEDLQITGVKVLRATKPKAEEKGPMGAPPPG